VFRQAHYNIMREVDKVLENIEFDPMMGMYSVKDANLNQTTDKESTDVDERKLVIELKIGSTQVDGSIIWDPFCREDENYPPIKCAYIAHVTTATTALQGYTTIIPLNLQEYQGSGLPTILRPVLAVFRTDGEKDEETTEVLNYRYANIVWVTKSFQGSPGPNI